MGDAQPSKACAMVVTVAPLVRMSAMNSLAEASQPGTGAEPVIIVSVAVVVIIIITVSIAAGE